MIETCTGGGSGWLGSFGLACLFVAPFITTAYLALKMRRRAELTATS